MPELKVRIKTVWDKERFQPMNELVVVIAQMIGCKTLSRKHLLLWRKAGWDVNIPNVDVDKFLEETQHS